MHPIRRRKKRPNYGVRTVEVSRGKNGFGFTISGQQPCILSCIVNGSPADRAGLRPGDYLVAVNGQSVSKVPHDDVVRLIGCSNGMLKLQIAENYYSSDEEQVITIRSKPKFVHKNRNLNTSKGSGYGVHQNRIAKVVRDLRTGVMFDKYDLETPPKPHAVGVLPETWDLPALPPPRPNAHLAAEPKEELCFFVGYLGTIEMPKQILPGCRSQVVRGCIKKLRAEKRSHNWVVMKVHADGVTLTGSGGKVLADYPVHRITFCGPSSEEDRKYIGLVTAAPAENGEMAPSSSCHVFAVQANLFEHQKHAAKTSAFNLECTHGSISEGCFEFPSTSEPVLNAIKSFCLTNEESSRQAYDNEMLLANSPQPSQAGSTAASSNSDSGIGFRDDCGNQSDRIVMVDIENQRLHIQQLCNSASHSNSLDIHLQRSADIPSANLQQAFACVNALCPLPVSLDPLCGPSSSSVPSQQLTVRPAPDPSLNISCRSRSPLSSTSSSEEDLTMSKSKYSRVRSRPSFDSFSTSGESSKAGAIQEQHIFYHLGLPSTSRVGSKSFDNLGHPSDCSYKTDFNFDIINSISNSRYNSKSIDNLMHVSPQHSAAITDTISCKDNSLMSISFGGGTQVQKKREPVKPVLEESVPSSEVLLSYSMSPQLNMRSHETLRIHTSSEKDMSLSPKKIHFKSADDVMSICSYRSSEALLSYKLSPKVFGVTRPLTTQSLEQLSSPGSYLQRGPHWGSLQDLRSTSHAANLESSSSVADLSVLSGRCAEWVDMKLVTERKRVEPLFVVENNYYGGSVVKRFLHQRSNSFGFERMQPAKVFHDKQESNDESKESGVVSWSSSFEKLLEDPLGLLTFSEFLKKEFSQENITFWLSCEKYRKLSDETDRKQLAAEIYETHLDVGATEPVNVDAQAHQCTQDNLAAAPSDLFLAAQKQIFNLMKFDSFPRFIKSELYKECLLRDLAAQDLELEETAAGSEKSTPNRGKLKKSRSDAEDCRRKSLLPWHRKNRSKSKDRGESEYKLSTLSQRREGENDDSVSVRSEITSSRSSLASWDLALRGSFSRQSITSGDTSERENCPLCRVILSDGATTVVQVRPGESVRELVHRLLEKRGLQYSSFEVFPASSTRPLDLDGEALVLGNKEVRVEQRVVFRLDLPNRKTISVKAKTTKTLGQVLRPVLHKYSFRLEAVTICSMSENEVLEMSLPMSAVDGRRLTVLTRSGESSHQVPHTRTFVKPTAPPTLDEITNRVFEELLQGKSGEGDKSAAGSIKSEEWGSEHSTGMLGKFLRRDSAFQDKQRKVDVGKPPLVAKWRPGVKHQGKSDSDELYEGLKRAQRSRLEDQRGTEINFELPDFLKDKENSPQNVKKIRKLRREDGSKAAREGLTESSQGAPAQSPLRKDTKLNGNLSVTSVSSNQSKPDLAATSRRLEEHLRTSKPLTCKTYETPRSTAIQSDAVTDTDQDSSIVVDGSRLEGSVLSVKEVSPRPMRKSDPPPLPPKPKYLPPKTSIWSQNSYSMRIQEELASKGSAFLKPSDVKRDVRLARSRRAVYLDQPSSSFV